MRAFPGVFVVMTIVGADRALEVCFLLRLVGTFSRERHMPPHLRVVLNTPHTMRSV